MGFIVYLQALIAMIPTSSPRPLLLPDSHRQYKRHCSYPIEWTPPEESPPPLFPSLSFVESQQRCYHGDETLGPVWNAPRQPSRGTSFPEPAFQNLPGQRIATTPLRSNRYLRSQPSTTKTPRRRKRKTRALGDRPAIVPTIGPPPSLPSLSSSPRSNRIYLRINRVVTSEKVREAQATKPQIPIGRVCERGMDHLQFDSSRDSKPFPTQGGWHCDPGSGEINVMGFRNNCNEECIENRFENDSLSDLASLSDHLPTVRDSFTLLDDPFVGIVHPHPTTDKILMIEQLLGLDAGPISWNAAISEPHHPPESFVWYLAHVLSGAVQVYLTLNTPGKEYWIKHVQFWSDLLDPEASHWNTCEGSSYKDMAQKLHCSLLRNWGGSDWIDCKAGNQDPTLFVRACILFARANSHDNYNQRASKSVNQLENHRNNSILESP